MLTKEELATLDRQGYVSLGKLLTDEQVKAINNRIEELLDQEGKNAGSELAESKYIRHPKEAGADRLADLVNKGEVFDVFYTHSRVLAGIAAVLGSSFKLSSLNYRAAKPGQGHQKLHVDWGNTLVDGVYKVCNSIWLLDDFTENNGLRALYREPINWVYRHKRRWKTPVFLTLTKPLLLPPQGLFLSLIPMLGTVEPPTAPLNHGGVSTAIFALPNSHSK